MMIIYRSLRNNFLPPTHRWRSSLSFSVLMLRRRAATTIRRAKTFRTQTRKLRQTTWTGKTTQSSPTPTLGRGLILH